MTFYWLLALPNNYTGPYWLITGPSYGLTVSTFHSSNSQYFSMVFGQPRPTDQSVSLKVSVSLKAGLRSAKVCRR